MKRLVSLVLSLALVTTAFGFELTNKTDKTVTVIPQLVGLHQFQERILNDVNNQIVIEPNETKEVGETVNIYFGDFKAELVGEFLGYEETGLVEKSLMSNETKRICYKDGSYYGVNFSYEAVWPFLQLQKDAILLWNDKENAPGVKWIQNLKDGVHYNWVWENFNLNTSNATGNIKTAKQEVLELLKAEGYKLSGRSSTVKVPNKDVKKGGMTFTLIEKDGKTVLLQTCLYNGKVTAREYQLKETK